MKKFFYKNLFPFSLKLIITILINFLFINNLKLSNNYLKVININKKNSKILKILKILKIIKLNIINNYSN